ncbi:endonuclease III [Oscillospiraceae bacterium 50-16]
MNKTPEDIRAIVEELKALYPEGICSLEYQKDYELLFSVRLAAQCTDERVNKVTPALYKRFPTLEALAEAEISEVEEYIHSTGFFRAKAKDIVLASQMLLRDYGGKVPNTMEDLLKLPGVGRKTANLILGDVYHTPGVVVADTHCIRITGLLGLTDGSKDPVKVEQQLRRVLPPEESNDFCHRMVLHGRAVCIARRPQCQSCTLRPWCDYFAKSSG